MDQNPAELSWPELSRVRRALVVVDVVESVRLMQQNEADVIDRWRRFVNEVQTQVLPQRGGRLVKSLGDGMLLEFESVPQAVGAAMDILDRIAPYNAGRPADACMQLRVGAHVADVVVDDLDIYGAGVNLAARLATLAGPGEIVVSAEVRDRVLDGFDADTEDLGECYLKHLAEPVRAYRVSRHGSGAVPARTEVAPPAALDPTVAVIPFAGSDPVLGEFIADGLIAQLSCTAGLNVISRLSTSALQGRVLDLAELRDRVGITYVLSGRHIAVGSETLVHAELCDTRSGHVVWADRLATTLGALLEAQSEPLHRIADATHHAILSVEVQRARNQPLPTLEGFSLLLGSIGLLHRAAGHDFERAHAALQALAERVPRLGAPHAWLAKWHALRIVRGQSPQPQLDHAEARSEINRALERDPLNSIALSLQGLILGFFGKDLAAADRSYAQALECNPNEPLAWLFTGTLRAWQGRGAEAAAAAEQALKLSPLDPLRYYFDSLAGAAMLADGQLERAIALSRRSLRAYRGHTPTYRVLAIAQVLAGDMDGARSTTAELLRLEPKLTVAAYAARYPGGDVPHAREYARALLEAGVPPR